MSLNFFHHSLFIYTLYLYMHLYILYVICAVLTVFRRISSLVFDQYWRVYFIFRRNCKWIGLILKYTATTNNNDLSVKNDNGLVRVFIWSNKCFHLLLPYSKMNSLHVLSRSMDIESILFVSNENKRSIWHVFYIDPRSIK